MNFMVLYIYLEKLYNVGVNEIYIDYAQLDNDYDKRTMIFSVLYKCQLGNVK